MMWKIMMNNRKHPNQLTICLNNGLDREFIVVRMDLKMLTIVVGRLGRRIGCF